ncbi:MAG: methionyl-tRNA formyltransferase [Clostridiales bacterium]|nr:methionyl-tRNA formyltransferase [Clostridiales bacterium]
MDILFMGTPDFSVPCLEALIKAGHNIKGVFTQPDKPKGRGNIMTAPPVKVYALEHNIDVFQPDKMKSEETLEIIRRINPEVIVVVAFGRILPESILNYPKFGCINIHASLLPKYRGAGPIQWCIINGEKETGITTMKMDVGLDTGDMLLFEKTAIGENETAEQLHDRLSLIGASLIVKTLENLDNIVPQKQDDSKSCYAPMLTKELCKIDWTKDAQCVHNLVRGLNSWPIATASLNESVYKIYETKVSCGTGKPGEIISLSPLTVACGSGAVEIKTIQRSGKRKMSAEEFLRGNPLFVGDVFD